MAFHLLKWVLCFGGEVGAKVAKLIVDLPCSVQNCFLLCILHFKTLKEAILTKFCKDFSFTKWQ